MLLGVTSSSTHGAPYPTWALTLPENLLIITLTLADHCRAIRQGLLPTALLALLEVGFPCCVTRSCSASSGTHGTVPQAGCFTQAGPRLHPGPRGAPAVRRGCPRTAACPQPPPGWPPSAHAHAHLPGPWTQRGWAAASSSSLGPSPGCPLPVCGPSILDHSLCNSTPLLEAGVLAHQAPGAGILPGGRVHPGGRPRGRGPACLQLCIIGTGLHLPRLEGPPSPTHLSPSPGGLLTSASCSASPASPLLCVPEPQADHAA